jgi:hypothetical protein
VKNSEIIPAAAERPTPSRRMVFSLAAGVGAALPAMAVLSSGEAFAGDVSRSVVVEAIEAHKRAFAALEAADAHLNDFEQALPDEVTRQARVQVGGGWFDGKAYEPIWAYCPADIDKSCVVEALFTSPEEMEERRALLHAGYWADVDALHELRRSSGLSNMVELAEAAEDNESEALDRLLSVDLHSLDESRALAAYLREFLGAAHGLHSWSLVSRCFLALAGG